MSTIRDQERLALQGGMKAVTAIEGKGQPKIGIEEFMSVVERFGFSETVRQEIRDIVEREGMGAGPFLANYYSGLPESKVQAFERVARETFGTKYAIGASSGTGALHSAFDAVGVGPGTEVILPAVGFYATAAAVALCGGVPVFCDIDESMGMDPAAIEPLINDRTVALAPTHVAGSVARMDAIMEVARKHHLKVVEDCAQSCGGRFQGQLVGTFGDLGCFSISAYKIVGGGEGGLIITDEERLWDRANCMAEGGGLWRPVRFAPPRYEGELFVGGNYRMSELEAAVDVVQLGKMEATVNRFRHVKQRITAQLDTFREIRPQTLNDPKGEVGYSLRFFPESIDLAVRICEALKAEGIGGSTRGAAGRDDWHIYHYMYPLHGTVGHTEQACSAKCPRWQGKTTFHKGACPVADDLFERLVNIGINQWYTDTDCDHLAHGINKVLAAYCTRDAAGKPWC